MSKSIEQLVNLHNWYNSISKIQVSKSSDALRIGVLSAAAINPVALFDPVRTHPDARMVAVAARDLKKAQEQAKKFSIPQAYGSYDELLSQPDIDAVYIPLPNGLHCEWAIKAMKAGKHVLIEKPIASNADEARQILACAKETGKVALEAYHWQFHPASHVVKSLIDSGRYGHLLSTDAYMPLPQGTLDKDDIRFTYDKLAGGASMDLAYLFSSTRYFVSGSAESGAENYDVLDAEPRLNAKDKQIDDAMRATLLFHQPEGNPDVRSTVHGDLAAPKLWGWIPEVWKPPVFTAELEKATLTFSCFPLASLYHTITIYSKESGVKHSQKHYSFGPKWGPRSEPWWSTYRYQLEAFVAKIKGEEPKHWVSLEESVAVMECVDRVYEKAGLMKRGL